MLGAVVKVSGVIPEENFVKDMRQSFAHKFATKPQMIEGNSGRFSKQCRRCSSGE